MWDWVTTHWSTAIGVLAGLLAIMGVLVGTFEKEKGSAEQDRLLRKLDAKNEEIAGLQQKNLDFFTGGDSIFCFAFQQADDGPAAKLAVLGKNPVRDAWVTIFNLSLQREMLRKSPSAPFKEIREKWLSAKAADSCGGTQPN